MKRPRGDAWASDDTGQTAQVKRVAVVDSGGAGKTTFARELGRRTGIPVIHLDEHYWRPGWIETPKPEWRTRQRELLAGDTSIADGNYGGTMDIRFAKANTVIILAQSRLRCLQRVLRRSVLHHGREVQAAGCLEQIDLAFLAWVWRYPKEGRLRLKAALDRHRDRLKVIELVSPRQMRSFLRSIE